MWQVLGFFFLENNLHPTRLLGIPLCTHTGHCHHCAPGWSPLELCCAGAAGSQTCAEIEPRGESAQNEPSQGQHSLLEEKMGFPSRQLAQEEI